MSELDRLRLELENAIAENIRLRSTESLQLRLLSEFISEVQGLRLDIKNLTTESHNTLENTEEFLKIAENIINRVVVLEDHDRYCNAQCPIREARGV